MYFCLKATLKAMQHKKTRKTDYVAQKFMELFFFFLILGYEKYQLIMYIMT